MNILLIIYTLNNLAFGLGALIAPGRMMPGADLGAAGITTLRVAGAFSIATGVLAWLARGINEPNALKAILLTFLIATLLTAIVNTLAIRSGTSPASNWVFVGIDVVFALAFTYFRFFVL